MAMANPAFRAFGSWARQVQVSQGKSAGNCKSWIQGYWQLGEASLGKSAGDGKTWIQGYWQLG